jgi:hypothetical protein
MKYEIKYKELSDYLNSLDVTDFERASGHVKDNPNAIMKKGYTVDEYEDDLDKIPPKQIIDYGMPFLVDLIGNDLSVVILTRRKYKSPNGRVVRAKFDKTVIDDCRKLYGTPLNGYWVIPEQFITKIDDKKIDREAAVKIYQSNCKHDKGIVTNTVGSGSKCATCGKVLF